jgi:hypothetical protein
MPAGQAQQTRELASSQTNPRRLLADGGTAVTISQQVQRGRALA